METSHGFRSFPHTDFTQTSFAPPDHAPQNICMLRNFPLRLAALGCAVAGVAVALPVQSRLTRILILLGLAATVFGFFALTGGSGGFATACFLRPVQG